MHGLPVTRTPELFVLPIGDASAHGAGCGLADRADELVLVERALMSFGGLHIKLAVMM